MGWIQQYDGVRPVDRLVQLFYPDFDLSSSALENEGAWLLVRDHGERVWYDPYGVIRELSGQLGETVTIDRTAYEDGGGIYEVVSHKGNTVVRSQTFSPPGLAVLVRAYRIRTVKGGSARATLYPVVSLRNPTRVEGQTYVSRLSEERWLAVTVPGAVGADVGDVSAVVEGRKLVSGEHSSRTDRLVFRVEREAPVGGESEPVHLLCAFGRSREQALLNLRKITERDDGGLAATRRYWQRFRREGVQLESRDPDAARLWNTSLTLQKLSVQRNGLPMLVGFRPYQGNLWVRDTVFILHTLLRTGHGTLALRVFRALLRLLKKRPDGNYYFAYNGSTGDPSEHSIENDSTGLLLSAAGAMERHLGPALPPGTRDLLDHASEWILANRDGTGLVLPCAGISEVFGPHLDQEPEHMVWTSAISAYGLLEAARLYEGMGEDQKARRSREGAKALREAVLGGGVREGHLVRSLESDHLDPSGLLFFVDFPLFAGEQALLEKTVAAIENRLTDPFLGGIWRSDQLVTEEGDMRPWLLYTLLLARVYLRLGRGEKAGALFATARNQMSHCGLVPELVYGWDMPRGIAMPSYSQGALLHFLADLATSAAAGETGIPPVRLVQSESPAGRKAVP